MEVKGMTDSNDGPDPREVQVGQAGPSLTVADIDRKDFVKYAGASGDFVRLHYDEPFTKDAGHPSVFGQGMLIAGFASKALTDWVGVDGIQRFRTRFTSQVWPGDTISISTTVTDRIEQDEGLHLAVEFEAHNQDEETVIAGDADIYV